MSLRHDIILGGGLAGLTAAHTLQAAGDDGWVVIEKGERAGGHARSIARDGYVFDYGPHILFTNDVEMEALIRDLLGDNMREQERQAFIYHAAYGTYTRFPFQAHLYGLPVDVVRDCLVELVRAVEIQASGAAIPANYEEWMRATFGNGIAERLMIPYARKIWTVEPSTMEYSWIARRVPTPDVERIVTGALTDDVAQVGATANFWYPWRGGIEAVASGLAARINGISLRREMQTIDVRRRVVGLTDGDELEFDRMIFTLPLCFLPRWIPDLPAAVADACNALVYQGIFNVNIGVDRPAISAKHWVYFYEQSFPFHRLSFPGTFSPHNVPEGKSAVSTEVAYSPNQPFDRDRALTQTIDGLRLAGIIDPDDDVEVVSAEEIAPAYVIYDLNHRANVDLIRAWLGDQGIWTAGRFGEWGYLNMDHSMRSGRVAAEAVLARPR